MTVLLIAGLGVFAGTAARRWRLMRVAAAGDDRFGQAGERWRGVLRFVFGQQRMFRYRWAGWAHAAIFAGFVILLLRALILFARGFTADPGFGFWLFDGGTPLGGLYTLLKDLIGVAVIAGVAYFLYLRLGPRPKRIEHSFEGFAILVLILGIVLSDLTYEAAGFVRAATPAWQRLIAPGAAVLSVALVVLPDEGVNNLYYLGFWLHAIIVVAFLNLLPYGKHFHVLTVLPNVYFRDLLGIGRLRPVHDMEGRIERGQTLGVKTVRDFSWKAVLDFYTCTECGRCSDHCPATSTGKLLSPKHLTMNLRDHMYENAARLTSRVVQSSALPSGGSGFGVQGSGTAGILPAAHQATAPPREGQAPAEPGGTGVRPVEAATDDAGADRDTLVPQVVNPEVLWACTTCGACELECPVLISYIDKIVDMRRHLVMERGEFPQQLQNAFRGLESVGNPYSFDNSRRAEWAEGLDVPLRSEKPDAEYLYWVGCAPSFDDRSRRTARAFAQLLKAAGVDFAILGSEEVCNGDPARRAGNEFLFQTFAKQNVETLGNYNVRKIVTTCPHCFNIFRNEYPDFGGRYEVTHHTEFLAGLIRAGRLRPRHPVNGTIVYHDSCYLGRYNDVYDPPREILKSIPGLRVVEAPESRDRGMCCGAGGAQMWKEEEPGQEKVNHRRARQLLRVLPGGVAQPPAAVGGTSVPPILRSAGVHSAGPRLIATACPFCKTMISDGLTDQGHDDVTQQDVAELLLRAVQPAAAESVAARSQV